MKKFFYSVFVASTMLMATSCSQENELVNDEPGGEATQSVTFTIETGVLESRTAGDGKSVDQLHYEVWTNDNVLVISSIDGRNPKVKYAPEDVVDGKATVKLNLVRNVEYDITFWAQVENGNPYKITDGLDKISYTNKDELKANDEKYDAFFKTIDDFKVGQGSNTVILNRPFAQINVGTTDYDYKNAQALGVDIQKSEVTITKVHDTFNARTSEASGEFDVTFNLNDILDETFQLKDADFKDYLPQDYQFLGMNYVFADADDASTTDNNEGKSLHTLTIDLNTDNATTINTLKVNNMPMQRNWRTNIVGNLLTGDEEFQIIVDPEFDGEYNTHIWDGESIHKPEFDASTNTWIITTAPELAWVSSALINGEEHVVKGRAAQMTDGFNGQIIKLAYDIDLNGKEWTPIGRDKDCRFMGTFDGQGHTISNLKITERAYDKPQAALFGALAGTVNIKNLIIENAEIIYPADGKDFYGAALVATYYGNLKVENVKVVRAKISGNNKVAGLIAHDGANSTLTVDNCHVSNSTIETKDANDGGNVGGLIGLFQGNKNVEHKISNSSVTGCTINGINSTNDGKRSNGEFIGTIIGKDNQTLIIENCKVENNDFTDVQKDGTTPVTYVSPYGTFAGGHRGTEPECIFVVDGKTSVGSDAALLKALQENKEHIAINMATDLTINIGAWTEKYYFGGANTKTITIEGNGHTLTFNHEDTDWNYIRCVNEEAKWFINNVNLTNSGANNGPWNRHDIRFYNEVTLTDVTSDKAIAVLNDATLKNVTISDDRASDDYGLWISAQGQTVNLDGCTFNMIKNEKTGRGIKIADQYLDDPKLVVLNVKNSTFTTQEKAAVLVTSTAGAIINWGEGNDISAVKADQDFAVWVDEDRAEYAYRVTVNGALVKIEGSGTTAVKGSDGLIEALEGGNDVVLTDDVKIDPAGMSNAYGTTGINVKNGQTIDGGGNTLDIAGAGGTWDSGICTSGGLIKNITVTGSFRGIFIKKDENHNEKVVLDSVIIEGTTYTISCDSGTGEGLEATNCTFNGWTSYAATLGYAKFTNCKFGEGNGNAFCRPYAPTEFIDCEFEVGYAVDARAAVTFENCKLDGVALTADNLATLVKYNIANATVK